MSRGSNSRVPKSRTDLKAESVWVCWEREGQKPSFCPKFQLEVASHLKNPVSLGSDLFLRDFALLQNVQSLLQFGFGSLKDDEILLFGRRCGFANIEVFGRIGSR